MVTEALTAAAVAARPKATGDVGAHRQLVAALEARLRETGVSLQAAEEEQQRRESIVRDLVVQVDEAKLPGHPAEADWALAAVNRVLDAVGFDADSCAVLTAIDKQSPDIAMGVNGEGMFKEQGAGDQGLMFGFATTETEVLMPAAITYSHRLVERQAEVRKNGTLPWLRPDAKSQVTLRYQDGKIAGIDAGPPRPPLKALNKDDKRQMDQVVQVLKRTIADITAPVFITVPYLITPTGGSTGGIRGAELVEVPLDGRGVPPEASSEVHLHLEVYRRRPDVGAVVHAHPPHAVAMTIAG